MILLTALKPKTILVKNWYELKPNFPFPPGHADVARLLRVQSSIIAVCQRASFLLHKLRLAAS